MNDVSVLSRTQVVLYGLVGMFLGTILTGIGRDRIADFVGEDPVLVYGAYGVVIGGIFATLVATAVATRIADLSGERRARWHRIHTLALTTVVVGYLVVAAVAPRLVGLVPRSSAVNGLLLPGTGSDEVWAPVAAGLVCLLVLGATYYRFRKLESDTDLRDNASGT